MNNKDFMKIYQQVVFVSESKIGFDTFAIITAHNPLGRVLSNEQNADLNKDLQLDLAPFSHQSVIGASKDMSHQEASFAVVCSKAEATALADKYLQNAMYWISGGQLELVPIKLPCEKVHLGKFDDFLS